MVQGAAHLGSLARRFKQPNQGGTGADGYPSYDARFNRGPTTAPNGWNMTAPDSSIDLLNDVLAVIAQHGHDCT